MRPRFLLGAVLPFVLTVTACSGGEPERPAPTQRVPQGVAEQYSVAREEIQANGGERTVGKWRIGYVVEAAEPWFVNRGGQQRKREPQPGETHHIEIVPFEAETGRIVPNVPIRLEIVDRSGKVVQARDLHFYYSTFFHYADNFSIKRPGKYSLRVTLRAPTFLRHSETPEAPLAEGARVTFPNVELNRKR